MHWGSVHYAVTHLRNKHSNIQERSPNEVKVIFLNYKELLFRQEFAPSWGQILSFKRSANFVKGRN